MTATAAEIRAYGKAHGYTVPDRGNLSAQLRAEIQADMDADQLGTPDLPDDPFGDFPAYDEGVTAADFPPDPEPGPPADEVKPRRVKPTRGSRGQSFRERIWGKTKTSGGKPKRRQPRVATDKLISGVWRIGSRLMAPVDLPVARVLDTQAPVAGVLLDPLVKETFLDTILQPLARMEAGGETVFALAGPPVLVGLLHRFPEGAPIIVPALEEAIVSWMTIAGPAMVEAQKKRAEFQAEYGADVQALIRMWFAGVEGFDPEAGAQTQPEPDEDGAEAVADAQRLNDAAFGKMTV